MEPCIISNDQEYVLSMVFEGNILIEPFQDAEPLGMIPVIGSILRTFPDIKLRFEISHPGDMLPSFTLQVPIMNDRAQFVVY